MRFRLRLLTPITNAVDSCGTNLTDLDIVDVGALIIVDGVTVVDTPDISTFAFPATAISPNDIKSVVSLNSNCLRIQVDHEFYYLEAHESATVYIKITKAGWLTYENTFVVYGYDLGNDINQFNSNGDPIDYNLDTDIVMEYDVPPGSIVPLYTKFAAYRKPFSDRIYIYNLSSGNGSYKYLDQDDNVLVLGANGAICNKDTIKIKQVQVSTDSFNHITSTCTSELLEVPIKIWKPDFNVVVSCNDCDDGSCISEDTSNIAQALINYGIVSIIWKNDVQVYPFTAQRLGYKLYDHNGNLINQKDFNWSVYSLPFIYDPATYQWDGWSFPQHGDYVVKVCFYVMGLLTGVELDSTNATTEGEWYKIKDISGGADFIPNGAVFGSIGESYPAITTQPTWGTGKIKLIHPLTGCCLNYPVKACNRYHIEQLACGTYKIHNDSFDDITYGLVKVLAPTTDITDVNSGGTIIAGSSVTITIPSDGSYILNISISTGNSEGQTFSYVIFVTCNIESCSLSYIQKLLCPDCCKLNSCQDYCKDFYDFNAFMLNATTLFSMINSEYSLNYIYTAISADKLKEIYEVQQVLDRLSEYCATCATTTKCCSSCSSTP